MSAPAPVSPLPVTYSGPPDSSEGDPLLQHSEAAMGQDEQLLKPEAKQGDNLAKSVAMASTYLKDTEVLDADAILIRYRYS